MHLLFDFIFDRVMAPFSLILFLTELWHLFDVNAVAGHGAVLAAFLFTVVDVSKFKDRRVHCGNSGMKGLKCVDLFV